MAGVKSSMYLFIIAAFLFITQGMVSLGMLDDVGSAVLSFTFAFVMFLGAAFAGLGRLMAVQQHTYTEDLGNTRISHYRDTGNRIQCTPCWGFCSGTAAIIITFLFAEPLFVQMGESAIALILPAILGAIFAFLAAIAFIVQYKGPYSATAAQLGY
jgi:hypothetical protein